MQTRSQRWAVVAPNLYTSDYSDNSDEDIENENYATQFERDIQTTDFDKLHQD